MNQMRVNVTEREFVDLARSLIHHRPFDPTWPPDDPDAPQGGRVLIPKPDELVNLALATRDVYLTSGSWRYTAEMQTAGPWPQDGTPDVSTYWLIVTAV